MLPNWVKQFLVGVLTLSVAEIARPELISRVKSSIELHKNNDSAVSNTKKIEVSSVNTQRVGLIGEEVRATITFTKNNNRSNFNTVVLVKFDANVVVNAFGRKGCRSSSCLIDVRFDNGKIITYKLYESDKDYLKTVLIRDSNFLEKFSSAKTISIKMRFADFTDGVFIFKNSQKKTIEVEYQ